MRKYCSLFLIGVLLIASVCLAFQSKIVANAILGNVDSLCDGESSEYYDYAKIGQVKKEIQVQVGTQYNPESGQYEAIFEWRETTLTCCVFSRRYQCAKALHNPNC